MNRRRFLQALGAVGVGSALALDIVAREVALPPRSLGFSISEQRFALLKEFSVYTCEEVSRGVTFGLERPPYSRVLQCGLNALGGFLRWAAPPGQEIVILRGKPLDIVHDFDGACTMVYETPDDRKIRFHSFILRRPLPGSTDELVIPREVHDLLLA